VFALLVELALRPPSSAAPATLLRHTINDTMPLLVTEVFLQSLSIPIVPLAGIFTFALPAPIAQSVLISASLIEFIFVLQLVASAALLHFLPP
jgi:hypothetical protein